MKAGPRRNRRSPAWRWLLGVALALIVGAGLLLTGMRIAYARIHGARAGRMISHWASRTLSGRGPTQEALVIERVEYAFWPAVRSVLGGAPLPVDVYGFAIWDPDGHRVMSAPHVRTGLVLHRLVWRRLLALLPFVAGDTELHFVGGDIDSLACTIARDRDGRVNLVAAFARKPGLPQPSSRGGLRIFVDGSIIRDGHFRVTLKGWEAELSHIRVEQRDLYYSSFQRERRAESPAFTYHVERLTAPSGEMVIAGQRFPLDQIVGTRLEADDRDRQNVHLASTAHCRDASLHAHGELRNVYGSGAGAELTITAQGGARLLAMVPAGPAHLGGKPEGTLHVSGPFAAPILEGDIAGVEAEIVGFEVHQARAGYRWAREQFHVFGAHAEVAGGQIDGRATVDIPSRRFHIELQPKNLHVEQFGKLAPVEILAALRGPLSKRLEPSGELVDRVRVYGIDIELVRSSRVGPPQRVLIDNDRKK